MGEISVPTEEFAMLNRRLESSGFGSVCSDCCCLPGKIYKSDNMCGKYVYYIELHNSTAEITDCVDILKISDVLTVHNMPTEIKWRQRSTYSKP